MLIILDLTTQPSVYIYIYNIYIYYIYIYIHTHTNTHIYILFFFFFLAAWCSLWDLSSLTRDQTRALSSESTES